MNTNAAVKKFEEDSISTKNSLTESYKAKLHEEKIVKLYEFLYSELYLRALGLRMLVFISFFILALFTVYVIKNPELWSRFEFYISAFSALIGVVAGFFAGYIKEKSFINIGSNQRINSLEDSIIKTKLHERFGSDIELNNKIEDFYIEVNNLTKAKYETAFRFYSYELYFYSGICILISIFFIFKSF